MFHPPRLSATPPATRILTDMDITLVVPAKSWKHIPGTDVEIHAGEDAAEVELTPMQDQISGRRAVQVTIGDVTLRIPAAS